MPPRTKGRWAPSIGSRRAFCVPRPRKTASYLLRNSSTLATGELVKIRTPRARIWSISFSRQVGRVAVGRDAVAQHPAGVLLRLVDLDVVPEGAQVVGRREAGRAGADDADPLAGVGRDLGLRVAPLGEAVLGRLGLHRPDEDGAVVAAADAGGLARRRADVAAGLRQRVVAPDDLDGGAIVAIAEVGHEGRDVDVGRAGAVAGRGPALQADALPGTTPAGRGAPTARGSSAASCRAARRPPAPAWRAPSPSRRARRDGRPRRGRA